MREKLKPTVPHLYSLDDCKKLILVNATFHALDLHPVIAVGMSDNDLGVLRRILDVRAKITRENQVEVIIRLHIHDNIARFSPYYTTISNDADSS